MIVPNYNSYYVTLIIPLTTQKRVPTYRQTIPINRIEPHKLYPDYRSKDFSRNESIILDEICSRYSIQGYVFKQNPCHQTSQEINIKSFNDILNTDSNISNNNDNDQNTPDIISGKDYTLSNKNTNHYTVNDFESKYIKSKEYAKNNFIHRFNPFLQQSHNNFHNNEYQESQLSPINIAADHTLETVKDETNSIYDPLYMGRNQHYPNKLIPFNEKLQLQCKNSNLHSEDNYFDESKSIKVFINKNSIPNDEPANNISYLYQYMPNSNESNIQSHHIDFIKSDNRPIIPISNISSSLEDVDTNRYISFFAEEKVQSVKEQPLEKRETKIHEEFKILFSSWVLDIILEVNSLMAECQVYFSINQDFNHYCAYEILYNFFKLCNPSNNQISNLVFKRLNSNNNFHLDENILQNVTSKLEQDYLLFETEFEGYRKNLYWDNQGNDFVINNEHSGHFNNLIKSPTEKFEFSIKYNNYLNYFKQKLPQNHKKNYLKRIRNNNKNYNIRLPRFERTQGGIRFEINRKRWVADLTVQTKRMQKCFHIKNHGIVGGLQAARFWRYNTIQMFGESIDLDKEVALILDIRDKILALPPPISVKELLQALTTPIVQFKYLYNQIDIDALIPPSLINS